MQVEALYRSRYSGFTAKHFHEHLGRDHHFAWGYTWTKTFRHSKGLALEGPAARGASAQASASANSRPDAAPGRFAPCMARRPAGARSDRHARRCDERDLFSLLVDEEGTASTFRALDEVFGRHGLPLSLSTDRGSHYFHTPEVGGKADRTCLTQVGRALAHLGVEHIAAYSPIGRPQGRPSQAAG